MSDKTSPEKTGKKRKNSKGKGNGFEGLIAKKLSAALPINFIRSPGSGARIGGKNFATIGAVMGADAIKLFNTDVVPVNEKEAGYTFRFSCECKFYATPDNFTSLAAGSANLFKWFEESVVDSEKVKRRPMLIFKWNRTPIYVAVDAVDMVKPPLLQLIQNRHLAIYELDELLTCTDFWVVKRECDAE